jgi:hypothetical protein
MDPIKSWIERKRLVRDALANEQRPVRLVQESMYSWRVVYSD